MSTPSEKLKTQLLKESVQREEDTIAVAKSQEPITPSIELDEETKPLPLEEDLFYISLLKPKKKKEEEEDEKSLVLAICRYPEGVCVQVDMDLETAKAWCDAANKLLNSHDPNDRAKGESAWNLLRNGKENESLIMLGLDDSAQKTEKSEIELKPLPNPITKNVLETLELEDVAKKTGETSPSNSTATKEEKKSRIGALI